MFPVSRRAAAVNTLAVTAVTPALIPAAARAQPAERATFQMDGDAGDYITGGRPYSYDTADGDALNATASTDRRSISGVHRRGERCLADGRRAASQGQQLQPARTCGRPATPSMARAPGCRSPATAEDATPSPG